MVLCIAAMMMSLGTGTEAPDPQPTAEAAAAMQRAQAELEAGHLAAALQACDLAVAACQDLAAGPTGETDALLARSLDQRGIVLRKSGQVPEALRDHSQAIEINRRLVAAGPDEQARAQLALSLGNRGNAQRAAGDLDQALHDHNEAIQIYGQLSGDWVDEGLAKALTNRGVVLRERLEHRAALADYDRAVDLFRRRFEQDRSAESGINLARLLTNRGIAQEGMLDSAAALRDHNQVIEIYTELIDGQGSGDLEGLLAIGLVNRGAAQAGVFETRAQSIKDFDRAVEILGHRVERTADHRAQADLAAALGNRAVALAGLDRFEEALSDYLRVVQLYSELVQQHGRDDLADRWAMSLTRCAAVRARQGFVDEAIQDCDRAIEIMTPLARDGGAPTHAAHLQLIHDTRDQLVSFAPAQSSSRWVVPVALAVAGVFIYMEVWYHRAKRRKAGPAPL